MGPPETTFIIPVDLWWLTFCGEEDDVMGLSDGFEEWLCAQLDDMQMEAAELLERIRRNARPEFAARVEAYMLKHGLLPGSDSETRH